MTPREQTLARYAEWLRDTVRAPFGFDREIAALASRAGNEAPPVEDWHRIMPVVGLVAKVRERFGPTTITSAYRSKAYNARVRGAASSRHVQHDALDFKCNAGTPAEWAAFLRTLRDAGEFRGGIGVYRRGWVHVDTRGTNADWSET